MTLNELEADVFRRLNKRTTSVDTLTQARIRAFLNQRHRELLTIPDAQQLRDHVWSFASVANQAAYTLPAAAVRINRLWQADNERVLFEQSLDWYRQMAPDPTVQTGDPEVFIVTGLSRVAVQPSDASQVWIKSSSASDTAITITMTYTNNAGELLTATATLNGTTAVQVGTSSVVTVINNIYLSAAPAGTVTLHEDSGTGTTLATFPLGSTTPPDYWRLILWPTPASVLTYTMDYTARVRDMDAAADEPLLPEDFHRVLIYGACADECLHMDDQRYATFKGEWAAGVRDFKYWLHTRPSRRPGLLEMRGGSQLGAWFPSGRW